MRISRPWLLRLLSVGIGMGAPLLALEILFRLTPTTSVALRLPVDAGAPVARFPAEMSYQASVGWNFKYATRGRTNNAGFVHDEPYDARRSTPLLALIGDSFIEAMTVPFAQSLQGRLAAAVKERGRVYSFGMSGAPLSQYLVWAEHAKATYKPDAMLVNIVANDFDESLLDYKLGKGGLLYGGFHYFSERDGRLDLTLVPYRPSRAVPVLERSALARYLVFHLKVQKIKLGALIGTDAAASAPQINAQERALRAIFEPAFFEAWPERSEPARRATLAFLDALPARAGLPPERIVLTVDGLRTMVLAPALASQAEASHFGQMRRFLMAEARRRGFVVLDLHAPLARHYASTGERVEFEHDYHWNGAGYGVVADEVMRTELFKTLFAGRRKP